VNPLRTALRLSALGLPRGPHIIRYAMYRRLAQVMASRVRPGSRILSISHSTKLCELLDVDEPEVVEANYPKFNMLALPFGEAEFDYVVSDQVLEHVVGDPQVAINETWRILKPGGLAMHTTCFMMPFHGSPQDLWRFSPEALRLLCRKFKSIVEIGAWGNRYVWLLVQPLGLRFEAVPDARWHPLHRMAVHNDPKWPVVTWIVAQK